jgi:hypothetical protein
MGSSDELIVDNWFGGGNATAVQSFATEDGLKRDAQVSHLVQAMAAYSSQQSWLQSDPSVAGSPRTLQNAIAAAWH